MKGHSIGTKSMQNTSAYEEIIWQAIARLSNNSLVVQKVNGISDILALSINFCVTEITYS